MGDVSDVETIAVGSGIRDLSRLRRAEQLFSISIDG